MKGFWRLLLLFVLVTGAGTVPADVPATIARVKQSIVGIATVVPTGQPPASLRATGFVVGDGRLVMTNAHVLPTELDRAKKEFLAVLVGRGREVAIRPAVLVAQDERYDLALLRLEGPPLPALALGDAIRVREGDSYLFTGFPIGMVLGMYPVTHRGMISAISPVAIPANSAGSLDRTQIKRLRDGFEVFQLDATAYPGNSGSPLFDPVTGMVVGVINKVFVKESKENLLKAPSGITYAIPVRHAADLLVRSGGGNRGR